MTKAIYRIGFDFGRQGHLDGIFCRDKEEVTSAIGKEVYFGEVLGKHSECTWLIEEGEIEMVTDDPQAVEVFEKYSFDTGYDPLDYLS
jgi:hypothetical protein